MPIPITAYDRPSVAISNLISGDPLAAGQALVSPEELAPSRTKTLSERMTEWFGGENASPLIKGFLSVATDPLVLVGLLMNTQWPVMGAQKLFNYGAQVGRRMKGIGFLEGLFGRAETLFRGSPIPQLMAKIGVRQATFVDKYRGQLSGYLDEFAKTVGRNPTWDEHLKLGAKLDRMDKPFKLWNPETKAMIEGPTPLAGKIVFGTSKEGRALQRLYDHLDQEFFPNVWKEVVYPLQTSTVGSRKLGLTSKAMKATEWGPDEVFRSAGIEGFPDVPGRAMKGYFPRTVIRTPEMIREYQETFSSQFANLSPGDKKQMYQAMAQSLFSGHAYPRYGMLIPKVSELERVGAVNPEWSNFIAKKQKGLATGLWDQMTKGAVRGAGPGGGGTKLLPLNQILEGDFPAKLKVQQIKDHLANRGVPVGQARGLFEKMEGALLANKQNEVYQSLRTYVTDIEKGGGVAAREYSLAFGPATKNYVFSLSRPYVWSVEKVGEAFKGTGVSPDSPFGKAFVKATNQLPADSKLMMNTDYLPMLMGRLTGGQVEGMMRWNNLKLRALGSLNAGWAKKYVPESIRKKFKTMLVGGEQGSQGLSYLNANAKVAGYFYFSALGLNPASALQNMLQPIITTLPAVGVKPYFKGLESTIKKLTGQKGYFALRGKLGPEGAFRGAFPEFTKAGLGSAPLSQAVLQDALEDMWLTATKAIPAGLKPGSRVWLDQAKRGAMFMFSKTEMFNRVSTFEAGLAKGAMDGLSAAKSADFAADLVRATQFPSGPGQMPRLLMKLPAPWRQFLYFPVRYAGFLGESLAFGGGEKRNFGTLGRSLLASATASHIARDVAGADVSRSLMFGALPLPNDFPDAPFFPFPLVPPIAGLIGGSAASLVTGEGKHLRGSLPLLMPGGIQMKRMYRTLAPRYARYNERTPDGRIPLFNDNKMLIGYSTPGQLAMKAIGLKPGEHSTEQALTSYLLKQRDKIRDMRRKYVEAIVMGNVEEAQRLQAAFKRQYPELGPIDLKKSDVQASRDRHFVTRVGRLLKTFPSEYRDQFSDLVSTSMSGFMGDMYGSQEPQPLMPMAGSAGVGSSYLGGTSDSTPLFGPASTGMGL